MKNNNKSTQNSRLYSLLLVATVILVIPLVAMLFTNEVNWSLYDFIIATIELYSFSFAIEYTLRVIKSKKQRMLGITILLLLLLLLWVELAVGLFGSPFAGN